MTNRDIEAKIRSAFENTVPDVLDTVLEQCSDQKGIVSEMTENKKRIPILKIAAVAAAAIVLLTVSVAAVTTFTGLIDGKSAIGAAMTYVVRNAETEEEGKTLANYILAGLSYDEMFEEQQAEFGLSGLRPVYNVSFKVGGYEYEVKVDAKTEVVLDCKKEIDENWEEYLDEATHSSSYLGWPEGFDPLALNLSSMEVQDIVYNYFGFTWSGHYPSRADYDYDFDDDPVSYVLTAEFGGKQYSCHVNSDTGKIFETSIEPIEDYKGEVFEPVPTPEGYLTPIEVRELALEYLGEKEDVLRWELNIHANEADGQYPDYYNVFVFQWTKDEDGGGVLESSDTIVVSATTGEILNGTYGISAADAKHIVEEAADIQNNRVNSYSANKNDDGMYEIYVKSDYAGKEVNAVVDPETGEIIKMEINEIPQKDGKPSEDALKNQVLNLEAPEGMISEAVAAAIAFENSGVNEQCVWALKVDLENGVYHISYWFGYDDFNETTSEGDYRTNTYEIDAVTGEILSFNALTPDDYIGEKAALAIAYKLAGISEDDIEKVEIKLDKSAMGYPQYIIALFSSDGYIYRYNLDAVNGYDHIVG